MIQLKTNQNGEQVPFTEADAMRLHSEHQAALTAAARGGGHLNVNMNVNNRPSMPPRSPPLAGLQGFSGAPLQAGSPMALPLGMNMGGMNANMNMAAHMYGYPGMVSFALPPVGGMPGGAPPPQQVGVGYQMPPGMAVTVNVNGNAPPMGDQGGIPGMNHATSVGMHAHNLGGNNQVLPDAGVSNSGPGDPGSAMTDSFIESLITDGVVVKSAKTNNENKNNSGNDNDTTSRSGDSRVAGTTGGEANASSDPPPGAEAGTSSSAKDDMTVPLVVPKDRDLIPDALFVALGQMKPTRLQQSDRVGCYKTRQLGFLGMCCKHCGGQPGFGRYFPNSVRSLAQTTTSQTILKHIGGKCRLCPPSVRKAVLELQRQQAHKDHLTSGRPRYGSRKIFFQRMWARLHGQSADGQSPVVVESDVSPETARAEAKEAAALESGKTSSGTNNDLAMIVPPISGISSTAKRESSSDAVRSPPSEVSCNNSDEDDDNDDDNEPDDGAGSPSKKDEDSNVVNIRLSLNNTNSTSTSSNIGGTKRKHDTTDKVDAAAAAPANGLHGDDQSTKKLRISPVETYAV